MVEPVLLSPQVDAIRHLAVAIRRGDRLTWKDAGLVGELIGVLYSRLKLFVDVPNKHIVYGGDIGGELARRLMMQVYGSENFRTYALILPCYPDALKSYVLDSVIECPNVTVLQGASECHAEVDRGFIASGECSSLLSFLRTKEFLPSLEVCGCFLPDRSLETFIEWHQPLAIGDPHRTFRQFWSRRTSPGGEQRYLYLFAQIPETVCQLIAFLLMEDDRPHWDWWRIHVCHPNNGYIDLWADADSRHWRLFRQAVMCSLERAALAITSIPTAANEP